MAKLYIKILTPTLANKIGFNERTIEVTKGKYCLKDLLRNILGRDIEELRHELDTDILVVVDDMAIHNIEEDCRYVENEMKIVLFLVGAGS